MSASVHKKAPPGPRSGGSSRLSQIARDKRLEFTPNNSATSLVLLYFTAYAPNITMADLRFRLYS